MSRVHIVMGLVVSKVETSDQKHPENERHQDPEPYNAIGEKPPETTR